MEVKVKVAQLYPILCGLMDCIVPGILQARILEWVAFPFSRGSFQLRDQPRSPSLQADSLPAEPQGKPPAGLAGGWGECWHFLESQLEAIHLQKRCGAVVIRVQVGFWQGSG